MRKKRKGKSLRLKLLVNNRFSFLSMEWVSDWECCDGKWRGHTDESSIIILLSITCWSNVLKAFNIRLYRKCTLNFKRPLNANIKISRKACLYIKTSYKISESFYPCHISLTSMHQYFIIDVSENIFDL